MNALTRAIVMAAQAHDGQIDKAGQPYILHPLRVMQSVSGEDQRIVAALHDVVEDCDISLDTIETEFGRDIRNGVDAMTRREGEDYPAFILRAAADPIARIVKLADIADNTSEARSASLPDHLRQRYHAARKVLLGQSDG